MRYFYHLLLLYFLILNVLSLNNENISIGNLNLIYIKVPKCYSTTVSGIIRQIGFNYKLDGYDNDKWINNEPGIWANHETPLENRLDLINKLNKPYFLITFIRNPLDRTLSHYYYFRHVQKGKSKKNDKSMLKFMNKASKANFISKYLDIRTPLQVNNIKKWQNKTNHNLLAVLEEEQHDQHILTDDEQKELVNYLLNLYDFIGICEKFNESLVILKNLLHINDQDLVYIKGKSNMGYKRNSFEIEQANLPNRAIKLYQSRNKMDYLLYNKAKYKLDQYIANLGINNMLTQVHHFDQLERQILSTCDKPLDKSIYNDCYWKDNGCGKTCISNVLKQQ